ncbi:MAG: hypothetical protein WCO72_10900 [Betaproteobacteria bacterium]
MKNRIFILLVILAGVIYLAFFMPSFTQEEALYVDSQPAVFIGKGEKVSGQPNDQAIKPIQSTLLKEREELLKPLTERTYLSALFNAHSWVPPVKKSTAPVVVPPPAAPPLPFKFLGKQKIGNEIKVFLAEGDKTLVVAESTKIGTQYVVESIAPPKMTLVYLPLNTKQDIAIGVFN